MENVIKVLRKRKGLTQEQLAEKIDVSVNSIYNWEAGKVNFIKPKNLFALLECLAADEADRRAVILYVYAGRR